MKPNDTFTIFGKEVDNRKFSLWLICGIGAICALLVIFSGEILLSIPALLFTTLLLGAYRWVYKPGKGFSYKLLIISAIATATAVGIAIIVEEISHYGI